MVRKKYFFFYLEAFETNVFLEIVFLLVRMANYVWSDKARLKWMREGERLQQRNKKKNPKGGGGGGSSGGGGGWWSSNVLIQRVFLKEDEPVSWTTGSSLNPIVDRAAEEGGRRGGGEERTTVASLLWVIAIKGWLVCLKGKDLEIYLRWNKVFWI